MFGRSAGVSLLQESSGAAAHAAAPLRNVLLENGLEDNEDSGFCGCMAVHFLGLLRLMPVYESLPPIAPCRLALHKSCSLVCPFPPPGLSAFT